MNPSDIEKIFRDEAGRALATLIRLVGRFRSGRGRAAGRIRGSRWSTGRVDDKPSNPRAWLVNVGRKQGDRSRAPAKSRFRDKQAAAHPAKIELNAIAVAGFWLRRRT